MSQLDHIQTSGLQLGGLSRWTGKAFTQGYCSPKSRSGQEAAYKRLYLEIQERLLEGFKNSKGKSRWMPLFSLAPQESTTRNLCPLEQALHSKTRLNPSDKACRHQTDIPKCHPKVSFSGCPEEAQQFFQPQNPRQSWMSQPGALSRGQTICCQPAPGCRHYLPLS